MTSFDSKAEAAAFPEFQRLGCISASDNYYPHTFTDADGTMFRSRPDFYHPASGCWIEYKAAPLNSRTTKATAERAESSQMSRKGFLTRWDWLQCGWNHAKAKQAIVQRQLTPQNFIVAFNMPPTADEANAYLKAGVVFIPMRDLASYLAYVRLLKKGLPVSFLLQYRGDDGERSVLALGPYAPAGWLHRGEIG